MAASDPRRMLAPSGTGTGRKVSSGEPSRSPGIRKRPGPAPSRPGPARRAQISRQTAGSRARAACSSVGPSRIEARDMRQPRCCNGLMPRVLCQREGTVRPCAIVEIDQPQIQQPFARVVDDVDMQPVDANAALQEAARQVFDRHAELADAARALGPVGRFAAPARPGAPRRESGARRRRAAA